MKYIRMTLKYFTVKKFLRLALVAALPALLFSFITTMSSISDYFINFNSKDLSSFSSIYGYLSEFNFSRMPYYLVIVFVFLICLCEIFGAVERDMRVGDFTLKGIFKRMNNNGFAVTLGIIYLIGSMIVWGLISAALFFLWAVVAGGGGLTLLLSVITAGLLFGLLILSWVNFFLFVPTMIITGQSTFSCIRDSIKNCQRIFFKLYVAIILPLFPVLCLIYVERAAGINVRLLVDFVINILLIVYYVVLMLVVHYDVTGMTREDLNPASRYFR